MTRHAEFAADGISSSLGAELVPNNFFGIQVLRGVAAMLVVFSHTVAQLFRSNPDSVFMGNLITAGTSGVDIFFVISGFVIFYTQFRIRDRSGLNSIQFMHRRFWRIFPLYWITITAMIILNAFGYFSSVNPSPFDVLCSIFLVPIRSTILPISWTLSYEMYFYVIFAIALLAKSPRFSLFGISAIMLLPVVLRIALPETSYIGSFFGGHRLASFLAGNVVIEFCAGMALAYLYLFKARGPLVPAWLMLPALLYLLLSPWIVRHELAFRPDWQSLKWGPAATLIVAAALALPARKTAGSVVLRLVGDASYAIYLTHIFVTGAYHYLLEHTPLQKLNQLPVVVLVCALSAIVGIVTHLILERPILRFTKRSAAAELSPTS